MFFKFSLQYKFIFSTTAASYGRQKLPVKAINENQHCKATKSATNKISSNNNNNNNNNKKMRKYNDNVKDLLCELLKKYIIQIITIQNISSGIHGRRSRRYWHRAYNATKCGY
jgi:hypothetical protein